MKCVRGGHHVGFSRLRLTGLPSGGAVRVSLGLASDLGDLDRFLDFAERAYRDAEPDLAGLAARSHC